MKKLFTLTLLFGLFTACQSSSQKEPVATISNNAIPSEITIATVDTDTVFAHFAMVEDLKSDLESTEKKLTDDLQRQAQRFQTDYDNYLKIGATMTLTEQHKREDELKKRQEELQALDQRYAQQLALHQQQLQKDISDKIFSFIETYNKEHGNYSLVISKSRSAGVLYSLPSMDVTEDFLSALNADYQKSKKSKK
ncbi:hypothetical protein FACS1894201_01230 [Bacteroidia bacterium]|nr:hypothetical protein FACS1894201_01230 [Bacteroidia bacterium]